MADDKLNSEGRKGNAAQPLGENRAVSSVDIESETPESQEAAGGDGPASKQDGLLGRGGDPVEGQRR